MDEAVPQDETILCPGCGKGQHGKDPLCDDCWREYLGTHIGGRGETNMVFVEDKLSVETAKAVLDLVNDIGFNSQTFINEIHRAHRTLQQSFTRLCLQWLYSLADLAENQYDLRNEASVKAARKVKETLGHYGDRLSCI